MWLEELVRVKSMTNLGHCSIDIEPLKSFGKVGDTIQLYLGNYPGSRKEVGKPVRNSFPSSREGQGGLSLCPGNRGK